MAIRWLIADKYPRTNYYSFPTPALNLTPQLLDCPNIQWTLFTSVTSKHLDIISKGETGALHHLVVMQAPNQKEHFEIFMEQEKLEAY